VSLAERGCAAPVIPEYLGPGGRGLEHASAELALDAPPLGRLELLPQPLSRDADLRLSVAPAEGLVLTGVRGDLEVAGPFDVARTVEVQATVEQPSWWDRPVTLG